jgi:hypothetical protein
VHCIEALRGKNASGGGNSTSYLLRRIAKKKPEILDAYERGEYPSVRAAAIAAAIISKPDAYAEIGADDINTESAMHVTPTQSATRLIHALAFE